MGALTHRIAATDGFSLVAREWADGDSALPLLCLPGLVRTSGDFADLAARHGSQRRVISLDYAGRGESGRARNVERYAPEACLRDVLDVCAALHVPHAIAIGTSFGGLLSMGLAAARPGLIRGVVLNDIGPEVASGGTAFIRDFVATDPALPSEQACVDWLRTRLPPLSLTTDQDWLAMAALTYTRGADGRFHPVWDTRIARLLDQPTRDLWPLFGALADVPVLLAWGEVSTVLLPDTVARMRAARQDLTVVPVPGIGHAPTLAEAPVVSAINRFLEMAG
jgi:pimeloyl-ACP methyl ester carboxylesterase